MEDVFLYLDGVAGNSEEKKSEGEARRMLRNLIEVYETSDMRVLRLRVKELHEYFVTQYPGAKDPPDVQMFKGTIREWEVELLWAYFGIEASAISALRLGFYKGDIFSEEPEVDRDVIPIFQLIKKVKPNVLSVAFDPEGSGPDTHYKALQAVAEALRMYEKESGDTTIRVWGYRNVWYRFRPSEADLMVPVSLNSLSLLHTAFMNCFGSQSAASFPSYEHDGPFSELAQKIQVEQYDMMKTCLGNDFFQQHAHPRMRAARGMIFLKEMKLAGVLREGSRTEEDSPKRRTDYAHRDDGADRPAGRSWRPPGDPDYLPPNVWTFPPAGTGRAPRFAPDGHSIFLTTSGYSGIWRYPARDRRTADRSPMNRVPDSVSPCPATASASPTAGRRHRPTAFDRTQEIVDVDLRTVRSRVQLPAGDNLSVPCLRAMASSIRRWRRTILPRRDGSSRSRPVVLGIEETKIALLVERPQTAASIRLATEVTSGRQLSPDGTKTRRLRNGPRHVRVRPERQGRGPARTNGCAGVDAGADEWIIVHGGKRRRPRHHGRRTCIALAADGVTDRPAHRYTGDRAHAFLFSRRQPIVCNTLNGEISS